MKHICDILVIVQSLHVRQFLTLIEEVERNLREAKSNIEYLQVYEKLCDDLSRVDSPGEIPEKIPAILHAYRFIWMHSPFYGTNEKITSLCRLLSNQIILQCTDFINLTIIFKEKHSREGISMFQTCIDCLIKYIKTYVLVGHNQPFSVCFFNYSFLCYRFLKLTPNLEKNHGVWTKAKFLIKSTRLSNAAKT